MAVGDAQNAIVGRSWSHTGLVLVVGLVSSPFLAGATAIFHAWLGALTFALVGAGLAVRVADLGGDLLACWGVTLPYLFLVDKICWGGGLCLASTDQEALGFAVSGAFVLGSLGYAAVALAEHRHDDASIWVPVGYLLATLVILYLVQVALSASGVVV